MQLDAGLILIIHSPALRQRVTPGQAEQIVCAAMDHEIVTSCDKQGQAQGRRWPAPAGQGHPHPHPCPRTKASTGPGAPVAQRRGHGGGELLRLALRNTPQSPAPFSRFGQRYGGQMWGIRCGQEAGEMAGLCRAGAGVLLSRESLRGFLKNLRKPPARAAMAGIDDGALGRSLKSAADENPLSCARSLLAQGFYPADGCWAWAGLALPAVLGLPWTRIPSHAPDPLWRRGLTLVTCPHGVRLGCRRRVDYQLSEVITVAGAPPAACPS